MHHLRSSPLLAMAAAFAIAACAHSSPNKESPMKPTATPASMNLQPAKEWPLKFKAHSFGAYAYDTYGARVVYAGRAQIEEPDDVLQPSSASYGPNYQSTWLGGHIDIRNFPPPAKVTWRSKDGTPHSAEIDIGALFADEVVVHRVPREAMADQPDGEYLHDPHIALEINDRTIRVYMRAFIPTKELQDPRKPLSNAVFEPVLIKTYSF